MKTIFEVHVYTSLDPERLIAYPGANVIKVNAGVLEVWMHQNPEVCGPRGCDEILQAAWAPGTWQKAYVCVGR